MKHYTEKFNGNPILINKAAVGQNFFSKGKDPDIFSPRNS